jgi:hypothetical protein
MSTAKFNTWQNPDGSENYKCRAWVNFSGVSGSIRASGNVSSVTRNAAGDYTVNFSTAMPDTDYALMGWARGDATPSNVFGWVSALSNGSKTTSAIQLNCGMQQNASTFPTADSSEINISIFR